MLFNSMAAVNCNVFDNVPQIINIYVFHMFAPAVSGSQFRVSPFNGALLLYLTEMSPFVAIKGNSQIGVSIGYQGCFSTPLHILTITYFGQAISPPCSHLQVVPPRLAKPPGILALDCASTIRFATGGDIVINPVTPTCTCNSPVEETTWGKVKALYR
jgi:hypothetical protein